MSEIPLGYQQIANDTLATVATPTVPANANMAEVQNNGAQPCRWRNDGQNPTASIGNRLDTGESKRFTANLGNLRFIREGDGVTLDINYYQVG